MDENIRGIDLPFHILSVLDNNEGFHSGYETKELASVRLPFLNEQALKLGIKTRYIVKEKLSD